jgi:hypothetical protein
MLGLASQKYAFYVQYSPYRPEERLLQPVVHVSGLCVLGPPVMIDTEGPLS